MLFNLKSIFISIWKLKLPLYSETRLGYFDIESTKLFFCGCVKKSHTTKKTDLIENAKKFRQLRLTLRVFSYWQVYNTYGGL